MKQPSVPWQRSLAHSTYPFCKKHNLVTRVLWVTYLQKHLLSPPLCVLLSAKYYCKQPPYVHIDSNEVWFWRGNIPGSPTEFSQVAFWNSWFCKGCGWQGETQIGWRPTHPRAENPPPLWNSSLAHRWQRVIASPPPIYFLTLTPMFPEFHNKPLRWYLFPDPQIS